VEPSRWTEAQIYTEDKPTIESHSTAISTLARVQPLTISERGEGGRGKDKALVLVLSNAEVVLPMVGMVDQIGRLNKEIEACRAEVSRLEARLKDSSFLAKAPTSVVERERGKLAKLKDKLERLEQRLSQLGGE